MIKPIFNFAHICESATLTGDGRVNILGIFTEVIAESKPIIYGPFSIVFNFTPRDKEQHKLTIFIKSPSDKDVFNFTNKIGPVVDHNSALGYILNIRGIKLEEEGKHSIIFYVDDIIISKLDLNFVMHNK